MPSINAFFGEHFDPSCPSQGEPSKLLYRNLALSLIVEPLAVTYWISVVSEIWDICYYADLLGVCWIVTAVSFFALTVVSMDRLLALLLGLRYRQVVTCLILFNNNLFMDFVHFRCIYFVLESSYYFMVSIRSNSFLFQK